MVNRTPAVAYFGRVGRSAVWSSPHELAAIRNRAGYIQLDNVRCVCTLGCAQQNWELECTGLDRQCCCTVAGNVGDQKTHRLIELQTAVVRPLTSKVRIVLWCSQTQQFGAQMVERKSVM